MSLKTHVKNVTANVRDFGDITEPWGLRLHQQINPLMEKHDIASLGFGGVLKYRASLEDVD